MDPEAIIRLSVMFAILFVLAIWEALRPRRQLGLPRLRRWPANIAIVVIDTIVVRICFPIVAVAFAAMMSDRGIGFFNLIELPLWLEAVLAVVLLDLVIYWQHRLFHRVPLFWRMHQVHHADPDIDLTTGLRFHPFEIVASMVIKFAAVALIGPAALAVLIFEIILNALALFNHANIRLPLGVDRLLRLALVTPDMHRVHHSVREDEFNRNFGFNLALWDRLFRSYRAQPADGHEKMRIGQLEIEGEEARRLTWMLLRPMHRGPSR